MNLVGRPMIMLAGEQAAPNLLPVRHYQPSQVLLLHSAFPRSQQTAENVRSLLAEYQVKLISVNAYEPYEIYQALKSHAGTLSGALLNVTGGTKPMSFGALLYSLHMQITPFYVRSQQSRTEIDIYRFDDAGIPRVLRTEEIQDTISIDDYLTTYFGKEYAFTSYGVGPGQAFEEALHRLLEPNVDEVKIGWKHNSGAVDVDLILRCNNQIGIVEAKTGGAAGRADGIKQLAVAGGQRFFGTYTKRFLVVDQDWSQKKNLQSLADALGIVVISLPSFSKSRSIDTDDTQALVSMVQKSLGKPISQAD
ncbi:MAG: hypothetical protein WBO46_01620 [Caldilineaceae bacterium]